MRKLNPNHSVYFSGPDTLDAVLKDVRKSTASKDPEQTQVETITIERCFGDEGLLWTASVVIYGQLKNESS